MRRITKEKNGKSSPAMISEDENVRIFDRQNRNSNIAKQAIFGPDLSVRLEISQSFQILIVPPAKAGGQGQPPQCLGSLGSAFAKHEFNQLIWFIFLGLPRKRYSSRVKSERSVKKLDTPPRNDRSERFVSLGLRREHPEPASPIEWREWLPSD